EVRYFRESSAGTLYEGTTRVHSGVPILLLPPAVRDGMQWQQLGTKGQGLGTFDVRAIGERATALGRGPAWVGARTNKVTTNRFTTIYVEGIGVVGGDNQKLISGRLPRQARPARPLDVPIPLMPVGDGPIQKQFWADHATVILPPSGAGVLRVAGQFTHYQ